MKKQNLLIILIVVCGITGIAYAASTTITNTYVLTPTLNVTTINLSGSCSGCGKEANFIHYNTIFLNATVSSSLGSPSFALVYISNNGTTLAEGGLNSILISPTGALLQTSQGSEVYYRITSQSRSTGIYQAIGDGSESKPYAIYKNGNLIQSLGLRLSQFQSSTVPNIAISPNAKYVVLIGNDASSGTRIVIFQGS